MLSSRATYAIALTVVVVGAVAASFLRRQPAVQPVTPASLGSSPPAPSEAPELAQASSVAEHGSAPFEREPVTPAVSEARHSAPHGGVKRMPTDGKIQGSLLLEPALSASMFSVRLSGGRTFEINGEGDLWITKVSPGAHDVEVCLSVEREPRVLLTIPHVFVPEPAVSLGEPVNDSRLQAIDVGALLSTAVLRLFDASGAPVERGQLGFLSDAHRRFTSARIAWKDGEVRVPLFDPPADVVVLADGYRLQRVQGLEGSRDVRLAGALSVLLELEPSAMPGPGLRLAATLIPEEYPLHPFTIVSTGGTQFLDHRGLARFELEWPGRYRVDLRVHGRDSAVVESQQSMVVSVDERDGAQLIPCPVSAADVARAVARLGR